jgi:hypothetical protein
LFSLAPRISINSWGNAISLGYSVFVLRRL